jgi:hypothetical protein
MQIITDDPAFDARQKEAIRQGHIQRVHQQQVIAHTFRFLLLATTALPMITAAQWQVHALLSR